MPSDITLDQSITYDGTTVNYCELTEGWEASLSLASASSTAERLLVCQWSDMVAMVNYLLLANTYAGFVNVIIGAQHPLFPRLFVDDVQVQPLKGIGSGLSTFSDDYVKLTVKYKTLQFDAGSPAVVREDVIQAAGYVITIPKESIQMPTDGKCPAFDDSFYVPLWKITSTFSSVASVPLGAIASCTNHVSSSDLTFNFGGTDYTLTGDQLLFCGPGDIKRTVLATGQSKYELSYQFLYSPVSHNKLYDHQSKASDYMSRFALPKNSLLKYAAISFDGLGV